MATTLLDLPEEIIAKIFENIPIHQLDSLKKVCTRFESGAHFVRENQYVLLCQRLRNGQFPRCRFNYVHYNQVESHINVLESRPPIEADRANVFILDTDFDIQAEARPFYTKFTSVFEKGLDDLSIQKFMWILQKSFEELYQDYEKFCQNHGFNHSACLKTVLPMDAMIQKLPRVITKLFVEETLMNNGEFLSKFT